MKIFAIIRGLRSCTDCDDHHGFFVDEEKANKYCDAQNEAETDSSYDWFALELEQLD